MAKFNPIFDQLVIAKSPPWGKRSMYLKRYVVPTETAAALQARLALARAAISARGRSLADVWNAIITSCSGKDYGGRANAAARKQAAYASADASVRRMEARLSGKRGGAPAGYGGAPPPPPPGRGY